MKALSLILIISIFSLWVSGFDTDPKVERVDRYRPSSKLTDVLMSFGEPKPLHYTSDKDSTLIQNGYDLVTTGRMKGEDGKLLSRQSKYFTCTDCHNIGVEDPDLTKSDPEARLAYAVKNGIPFLSGTTFYGMVNREHWYNDDYQIKYGALVEPAKDTLLNAIYLCTIECSQGRELSAYEMKSLMAYLYSIEYTLGDLGLNANDYKRLNTEKKIDTKGMIRWLKSKYLQASPATFLNPIWSTERSLGKEGNADNGKHVYDQSCKHCHKSGGVTNYILDDNKLTFQMLQRNMDKNTHYSLYDITRKGTYAMPGYKPYMPNYTQERLSHQQLEDLAAYINAKAN